MKYTFLAVAVATFIGAATAAPAQAFGPASPAIAPDAPITQVMTAARERRLQIIRNMTGGHRHGGYGRGGHGGGGYGYGGGPRGGGYGHRPHRHHHHHRGW